MNSLSSPLFGLVLTIGIYEAASYLYRRFKSPLLNPLLLSIIGISFILVGSKIDYEVYNMGGSIISFFLIPATVILAVPLYKKIDILKREFIPIVAGITVGIGVAVSSVFYLCKFFGISDQILRSLSVKSITTPIGVEVSSKLGGIVAITVSAIIMTGILGAVIGPTVLKIFKVNDKVAKGIALGTASHAIGTTKAFELGEVEGAMSSIALSISGILSVFLIPLILGILGG